MVCVSRFGRFIYWRFANHFNQFAKLKKTKPICVNWNTKLLQVGTVSFQISIDCISLCCSDTFSPQFAISVFFPKNLNLLWIQLFVRRFISIEYMQFCQKKPIRSWRRQNWNKNHFLATQLYQNVYALYKHTKEK